MSCAAEATTRTSKPLIGIVSPGLTIMCRTPLLRALAYALNSVCALSSVSIDVP